MFEYVVVVKDTRLGVEYYLNSDVSCNIPLTTDFNKATRFSCEELAVNAYKLLRNGIPKGYSAGVYVTEECFLVLKKNLCKKVELCY